jgi:hypothetical protein
VRLNDKKKKTVVNELRLDDPGDTRWEAATLVLTGSAPGKQAEFVFLDPNGSDKPVRVSDAVIRRFHDEDQITQWQEKAFPKSRPDGANRHRNGHLREGEPIFWLPDAGGGVEFLGRAQMFRLPYSRSPLDLVPEELRGGGMDLADVLFGTVGSGSAVKGRVRVRDAVALGSGPWLEDDVLVPRVLASPKVACFQHYLTQDEDAQVDALATYLPHDCTVIRGHKLYWHRWDEATGLDAVRDPAEDALAADLARENPSDTQHTVMQPVRAGVEFEGRLDFENLSDVELGALLAALQLPEGCAHKLGMGKPLGLGSVRIETRLELVDRRRRYSTWVDTGESGDPIEGGLRASARCREAFTQIVLEHAEHTGETMLPGNGGLRRIARLDALFTMLDWEGRPRDLQKTAYQDLDAFKQRPVLPTPHAVAGRPEPNWQGPAPHPQSSPGASGRQPGRGRPPRGPSGSGRSRGAGGASRPRAAGRATGTPSMGIQKGDRVTAIASRRNKKGTWLFRIEGVPQEAHVVHGDAHRLRQNLAVGDTVDLEVESVSSTQIRLRVPKNPHGPTGPAATAP